MGNVVITRAVPGTFDPETEQWSGASTPTTIEGSAIQKRPNLQRYQALGLALSTSLTLLFTPDDYELKAFTTDFVQPGDTVEWNDATYVIRDVLPVAPDGFVICADLIVSAGGVSNVA